MLNSLRAFYKLFLCRTKKLSLLTKKTEEDIKQDLFGIYLKDDSLHKRPLCKLIKDISKESKPYGKIDAKRKFIGSYFDG